MFRYIFLILLLIAPVSLTAMQIKDGDRIVLLGDALFEVERHTAALEQELHLRHPDLNLSLRNLSWSGDTPAGISRASFDKADKGIDRIREHLELTKPTVVFLAYGMAASLHEMTDQSDDWTLNPDPVRYGEMNVERFTAEMESLIKLIKEVSGEDTRIVLVSPIPHEDLRAQRAGLPDPAVHNALLARYTTALKKLSATHKFAWVDSAKALDGLSRASYTSNGIRLTKEAYEDYTGEICEQLGWPASNNNRKPELKVAILRKSDAFFHRFRPANATYLFGFRKREQGQNAIEMKEWDEIIAHADKRINQIKRGAEASPFPEPTEQGNETPELPDPQFTLPDGYEINLWADAPDVRKPVAMNWDKGGQLWVASTPIYPQIQPGRQPEDKIYVLSDTNGDGKADESRIFADDLLIPTGVTPVMSLDDQASTACYVGASTEVLLLKDTDGDGREDRRDVVMSGFGTEDTHHNIHTFKWGPDGRMYFNQSIYTHSHVETPYGVIRLNAGGVFAYNQNTERLEVFAKGLWNSWGHTWNADGQGLLSDGAGFSGIAWAFPGSIFQPSEGAERFMPTISPGRYPKYAGLELIDSRVFPDDWQGNAITCDFRAHRIVRFEIEDLTKQEPKRSGYVTRELDPLVVTTDLAFRPIDLSHGPDGALYVADWTNPIINHGEVDFRDPRRDQSNGRIWRITRKNTPNIKWSPTVRPEARPKGEISEEWISDSPRRRIEAMRQLARTPNERSAAMILKFALKSPADDPYYEFAVWRSIRDIAPAWVESVESGEWSLDPSDEQKVAEADLVLRSIPAPLATKALKALFKNGENFAGVRPWNLWIGKFGDGELVQSLFDAMFYGYETKADDRSDRLAALLAAQSRGVSPKGVKDLKASFFEPTTADGLRLIAAWKLPLTDVLEKHLETKDPLREIALESLAKLGTPEATLILVKILSSTDPGLKKLSLAALAKSKPKEALQYLPAIASEFGRDPAFWRPLLANDRFLGAFAKEVPKNWEPQIYKAALAAARERGRRGGALVKALQPLAGQEGTAPEARSIQDIVKHAETGGDPAEGELIYRRAELTCTLCHAIGGVGGNLGPDMSSLGASAPLDYIVESLIKPERKVKEGYHAVEYTLKDGSVAVGIPGRTSSDTQFILNMGGEQAIPLDSIKSKKIAGSGGSLMPAGLTNSLNRHELRNLISFLHQLGRPGPFDASNGGVARLWHLHPATEESTATKMEITKGGLPLATLVDGRATPEILKPLIGGKNEFFLQSRFLTTKDGKVRLKLEGISEAWVDGEKLPVASEPGRTLDLKAGTHFLTVKLDAGSLPPFFRASTEDARFLTE